MNTITAPVVTNTTNAKNSTANTIAEKPTTEATTINEIPLSNEELAAFYIESQSQWRDFHTQTINALRETAHNLAAEIASANKNAQDTRNLVMDNISAQNKRLDLAFAEFGKLLVTLNNSIAVSGSHISELKNSINNTVASFARGMNSATKLPETSSSLPIINEVATTPAVSSGVPTTARSIFVSSKSLPQQLLWVDMVKGRIANICETNNIEKNILYYRVWHLMKKRINISMKDLGIMFMREFGRSIPNKLELVSYSDELRATFEDCVNEIAGFSGENATTHTVVDNNRKSSAATKNNVIDCGTNSNTANKISYREANGCPSEITDIVKKLSSTGRPMGRTYEKAYRLLNIDLDELVAETAHKVNHPTCSVPFAISYNPETLSQFRNAVNKHIKARRK